MADLPRRTVTFLFTDIEGSTALWERDRTAMRAAVNHHQRPVRLSGSAMNGVARGLSGISTDCLPAVLAGLVTEAARRVTIP